MRHLHQVRFGDVVGARDLGDGAQPIRALRHVCLLYTSDAADERSSVDLGGRRILKTKNIESIGGLQYHNTTTRKNKLSHIYSHETHDEQDT